MAISLKDIVLGYVDDALDADDLETLGDYLRSVISIEGLSGTPLTEALQQLHEDLKEACAGAANAAARQRYKAALTNFEADFSSHLIDREIDTLPRDH